MPRAARLVLPGIPHHVTQRGNRRQPTFFELNPVRAGLVERPAQWRWSSARAHLGLGPDPLTDLAPARARIDDWRAFLAAGLADEERDAIRTAERTGRLLL